MQLINRTWKLLNPFKFEPFVFTINLILEFHVSFQFQIEALKILCTFMSYVL